MTFSRNDYLQWYMPRMRRADGAVNLHASGVVSLTVEDVPVHDVDPWAAVGEFESRLAGWLDVDPEALLFTPGATGGTLLALLTLTSAEQEILVERPVYEPMLRQSARLGTVRRFGRSPADGWSLALDEVREMITDRTGVVMVTEPANPSGTFTRREDLLAVADAAAGHGAWLLVNEVYLGYTDRPTLLGERDNVIVVSSLSKLLGAYWLRLGWLAGPPDAIRKLRTAHMNLSMPTKPAAALGLGVLDRADELRAHARTLASAGRDVVARWVESTDGVSWSLPQGPGFGCVHLPPHVGDDVTFAEKLHDDHGVLVVPGTHFEVPGSLRISWLQAGDRLAGGLETIGSLL